MLRRLSISPQLVAAAARTTMSMTTAATAATTITARRNLDYERLNETYYQESFEALQRFDASTTYPGSIKAATPGDTNTPMLKYSLKMEAGDRNYWRPIVDDPQPQRYVTIRIRFKEEVCVGDSFETHSHVVPVSVPADATIATVIQTVKEVNDSPYLCLNSFSLVRAEAAAAGGGGGGGGGGGVGAGEQTDEITNNINENLIGKALSPHMTLADAGILADGRGGKSCNNVVLDAIDDVRDHRLHEAGVRPLDWTEDEITPETENTAPYAELKLRENTTQVKRAPKSYRLHGKPNLSKYGVVGGGVQAHYLRP